jgi:hypothetical protein
LVSEKLGFDITLEPLKKEFTVVTDFTPEGLQNFSVSGLQINLKRKYKSFILKSHLPTLTLVIISGISFFVPPEIVPGRMALLITTFLMLINIANSFDSTYSGFNSLTAMDVWLRICMAFVALAIVEYALLLLIQYHGKKTLPLHKVAILTRSKMSGVDDDLVEGDPERKELCSIIDKVAAVTFGLLLITFNLIYWFYFIPVQ